ncbi:alpha/beta hydrolase [Tsuneonella sp. SYSU-LHT278]|uniref:alpha/beta hydrolase n=1 Tax=Tsuneonella sediminis TaxID=3416089 RepID=UPI003F795C1C
MTEASTGSPANGAMWGTDAHVGPSRPDAVLRYADHPRGFAELRLPKGAGPFPLAVIFHGGCFKYGVADQAYMAPLATRWQEHGIASLNVDYREVGDGGGWPGSFVDWAAAARLIDDVAGRYPVDRTRVTLVGHSAGGLPALWLASDQDAEGPLGRRKALRARAAIVLDGPADLGMEAGAFDALCQFSAVGPFLGETGAARTGAIAPRPQLDKVLFVQARLPAPPPAALAAIRERGANFEVRENPGARHFAVITPGDPVYAENEPAMLKVLTSE